MVETASGQGRWSRWGEGKRRQINGLWSVASLGKSVGVIVWMENVEGRHRASPWLGTLRSSNTVNTFNLTLECTRIEKYLPPL